VAGAEGATVVELDTAAASSDRGKALAPRTGVEEAAAAEVDRSAARIDGDPHDPMMTMTGESAADATSSGVISTTPLTLRRG